MNMDQNRYKELAGALISGHLNSQTVTSLNAIASSYSEAHEFVEALISQQSSLGTQEPQAISHSMYVLEKLAEISELTACVFMLYLWRFANERQMHDICDSIDIWISRCGYDEINHHLLNLAHSQIEESVKNHYQQMIK